MPDVHVVPSGDQWACEVSGNIRSTHATQGEAIKQGRFLVNSSATVNYPGLVLLPLAIYK
jgi:hypothetical protein